MDFIDAQKMASALGTLYRTHEGPTRLRALIISRKGKGKTTMLRTARKPVLLDLWDPNGADSLLDETSKLPNWLTVRDWTSDDPKLWDKWSRETKKLFDSGLLEHFGTYALDSTTSWADAHEAAVSSRTNYPLQIQDWGEVLRETMVWAKRCNIPPCDVLWFGHIKRDTDSAMGKVFYKLQVSGRSDDKVPTVFDEFYILEVGVPHNDKDRQSPLYCPDDKLRWLQIRGTGLYDCSTRIGRYIPSLGKCVFDNKEPADIKHLLKKAGLDAEDLPPLNEDDKEGETT